MTQPPKRPSFSKPKSSQKPSNSRPRPSRDADAPHAENTMGDDIGIKARVAALDLIKAALDHRGGFDEAMSAKAFNELSEPERSFARALAMIVLRRLGQFNRVVEKKTKKLPPEPAVALIRLGMAQLGFMNVPDFAAVSTTIKLAERSNDTRPYKGLINAILRGIIREGGLKRVEADYLLPDWLYQRYVATYGREETLALAETLTQEPLTDLSFKTEADLVRLSPELEGEALGPTTLRVHQRGDLRQWAGFDEGCWWVQDAAASIPVALLGDLSGQTAIDLCAAPGGKTLQLLASGATVVAVDRSKSRLKRVEENLSRAGFTAECHAADAEVFEDKRQFDVVLLDAPCSATGTYRRQPDVLWATKPSDVAKLSDLQHRLLDSAAPRVASGGRLVYCVCSLEREEGETQVLAFLRRNKDFQLTRPDPELIKTLKIDPASVKPEGWLRLLPNHRDGGQDGFFVAILKRLKG